MGNQLGGENGIHVNYFIGYEQVDSETWRSHISQQAREDIIPLDQSQRPFVIGQEHINPWPSREPRELPGERPWQQSIPLDLASPNVISDGEQTTHETDGFHISSDVTVADVVEMVRRSTMGKLSHRSTRG